MSIQKVMIVAEAKLISNVSNRFIRVSFLVVKHCGWLLAIGYWLLAIGSSFPKSGAKVLRQTAKTCQFERKNALFLQKSAFFRLEDAAEPL